MSESTEVSRIRVDQTEAIEATDRRLDSLTHLLSARSICVAASIVNETLYLAANELFKNSTQNNTIKTIKTIVEYFVKISRNESIPEQTREEIF